MFRSLVQGLTGLWSPAGVPLEARTTAMTPPGKGSPPEQLGATGAPPPFSTQLPPPPLFYFSRDASPSVSSSLLPLWQCSAPSPVPALPPVLASGGSLEVFLVAPLDTGGINFATSGSFEVFMRSGSKEDFWLATQ